MARLDLDPLILCAPTAFKGTLAPADAARRFAAACGGSPFPVADGGDGTLDVLRAHLGGRLERHRVTGPVGKPVDAVLLRTGHHAVLEMASASGLRLLAPGQRDPVRARTWGVGQLLRAAGRHRILLGAGGSATVDGGLGALAALGALGPRPDPEGLAAIRRTTVLCDVRTTLLDAPAVFGPQKGATPADVRRLREWMERWAAMLPRDVRRLEGSGAAGGLAGGLAAFGARLVRGADYLLRVLGFAAALGRTRLVLTGEGRFDETSLAGKAPGAVIRAARRAGVPVAVVCGSTSFRRPPPGVAAVVEAGSTRGIPRAVREAIQAAAPARR